MTRIGIFGITGRMGQAIVALVRAEQSPFVLCGGTARHAPFPDQLLYSPRELASKVDVLIDFSSPEALEENLAAAHHAKKPLVVGTTGLLKTHHALIDTVAQEIPLLQAANTSLGITLLGYVLEMASHVLTPFVSPDVDLYESHHRHKKDAPSGTAIFLAEAWRKGAGCEGSVSWFNPTDVTKSRAPDEIGLAVQRSGEYPGHHRLTVTWGHETLGFEHTAFHRTVFAEGALKAALWVCTQPAGRYTMRDLFLTGAQQ